MRIFERQKRIHRKQCKSAPPAGSPPQSYYIWLDPVTTRVRNCFTMFCSLFLAVSPLLSLAVIRCYFGTTVRRKSGFLRLRAVVPLYFSGIISDITKRRHHKRSPLRPVVACFPDLEAKNLNNLLLITFHSCTRRAGARLPRWRCSDSQAFAECPAGCASGVACIFPVLTGRTGEPGRPSHRISDGQPHGIAAS